MTAPPATYYNMLDGRLPGHGEPVDQIKARGILLDGTTEGGSLASCCRSLRSRRSGRCSLSSSSARATTRTALAKAISGALFECIERDQIERGVLKVEEKAYPAAKTAA